MEVLAARYRLGEPSWPFPSTLRTQIVKLQTLDMVDWQRDVVPGSLRVWLESKGITEWGLDKSYPRV